MTKKLPWTPWHEVVRLREDVRTGELSLADFAADLHDVVMQKGARPVYEDPGRFFALTYPRTRHRRPLTHPTTFGPNTIWTTRGAGRTASHPAWIGLSWPSCWNPTWRRYSTPRNR